ncbi:MAG: sortase A [Alphaproteobacteria bacterium]|jgi:sortase A
MSQRRSPRFGRSVLIGAVLLAIGNIGYGAYLPAKALLAQYLLRDAWARTLAGETAAKPWPWADTWPVARLRAPKHGIDLLVLSGTNGASLAFGPGHLRNTPSPGDIGNSIIGGHRDTSLSFLKDVQEGDLFFIEQPSGKELTFKMSGASIVNANYPWESPIIETPMLTLVTCYPFDAIIPGGPLRYILLAKHEAGQVSHQRQNLKY